MTELPTVLIVLLPWCRMHQDIEKKFICIHYVIILPEKNDGKYKIVTSILFSIFKREPGMADQH